MVGRGGKGLQAVLGDATAFQGAVNGSIVYLSLCCGM